MSVYSSLPILILNLGGEMFYILNQRLKAQNIPSTRAMKVLNEVAAALFNDIFIHEIFKPQALYNKQELYLLMKEIAHASIIKLNETSMGKLYDLMIMVFKYQLYYAKQPREILLITLNHLNSSRNLVSSPNVHKQLDSVYYLLSMVYFSMSDAELQRIRYDLLNYFQDIHIKVSIFLRSGLQNNDGTFINHPLEAVPYGSEIPGIIKSFSGNETLENVTTFPPGEQYIVAKGKYCFDFKANTGLTLGTSIYEEKSIIHEFSCSSTDDLESQIIKNINGQDYRREINTLMQQLLGSRKQEDESETVLLDLFADGPTQSESETNTKEKIKTVTICDTPDRRNNRLETAVAEISVASEVALDDTDDILYLLEHTQ